MKRFLLIATAFAIIAMGALFLASWIAPGWIFDVSQKIKYPEYYAWRDSGAAFPQQQFWNGFNTDRHRQDIFIGRTRTEIERILPLLKPIPEDDSLLQTYMSYRKIPPERFGMISGSMWILEFDENQTCVDIKMPKG